jgi:hypothetical protein
MYLPWMRQVVLGVRQVRDERCPHPWVRVQTCKVCFNLTEICPKTLRRSLLWETWSYSWCKRPALKKVTGQRKNMLVQMDCLWRVQLWTEQQTLVTLCKLGIRWRWQGEQKLQDLVPHNLQSSKDACIYGLLSIKVLPLTYLGGR